jgi:hypothetical protein
MHGVYCTTGRLKSVCRSEIWPVHEVGNLTKGVQHAHHYSTLSDPVNIRFVRRERSEVTSQNLCYAVCKLIDKLVVRTHTNS